MGFGVDIEGLVSLEPEFEGVDKVGISRNTVLESAQRMTDPLRHLKIWSAVKSALQLSRFGPHLLRLS